MLIKRGFEPVSMEHRMNIDEPMLPLRSTKFSAGYDFFAPYDVNIVYMAKIPTDVKALMPRGEVLMIHGRSSLAIKHGIVIANTVGIVDTDYRNNPDNDGNIWIILRNLSTKIYNIKKGERIAQGIFMKFMEADNCNSESQRKGGFGSTGK